LFVDLFRSSFRLPSLYCRTLNKNVEIRRYGGIDQKNIYIYRRKSSSASSLNKNLLNSLIALKARITITNSNYQCVVFVVVVAIVVVVGSFLYPNYIYHLFNKTRRRLLLLLMMMMMTKSTTTTTMNNFWLRKTSSSSPRFFFNQLEIKWRIESFMCVLNALEIKIKFQLTRRKARKTN
jgi:hypothetical protein